MLLVLVLLPLLPLTQVVAAHTTYSHVFFSPHLPNGIWLCDMAAQPCSR